jgi:hypothetical protein
MTSNSRTARFADQPARTVESTITRCRPLWHFLNTRAMASSILAVLITSTLAMPFATMAQSNPDATFTSTSTAMDGSLTYCGPLWNFLGLGGNCPTVAITPANQDTEGASGSDDTVANNLNVAAGSTLVATIGSSNDSVTDSDTGSNDSGDPTENQQNVSIFNGAITYTQVQASDDCVASPPTDNTIPVTCTVQATITDLEIQGVRVYPPGTQVLNGTQVPLTNIPITVNGVGLILNGTLTIGAEPVSQNASNGSWG